MSRKQTDAPGPGPLEVGYDPPLPRGKLTESEKLEAVHLVRWVNETLATRGVTAAEFSRQIGISHASVSRFLRGSRYATRPFVLVARKWLAGKPIAVPAKSDAPASDQMVVGNAYDVIVSDPWLDLPEL